MPQASLASFFGGRGGGGGGGTARAAVEAVVDLEDDGEDADSRAKRRRLLEVATPARAREREAHAAEPGGVESPSKEGPSSAPLAALPTLPNGGRDWLPLGSEDDGALPPRWAAELGGELRKGYFTKLRSFLWEEASKGEKIFPPASEVFSAFRACDLDAIRVVIIGQDPYHDVGQAHGLAFSVKPGVSPLPPSLRNMLLEGVLLLNTCLTVRAHQANSHQQQGWEQFTDAVVRVVSQRLSGVVFLLWGLPAQKKGACVARDKHAVIKTSHPSPLAALKTSAGNPAFLGSRCFSRCNEELLKRGRGPPIDWSIVA